MSIAVRRWYEAIGKRPAVRRAMEVGEKLRRPIEDLDEEARDVLFGGRRRTTGA
jgi:GSH-dependent disulfide-bond oxidoreductase